MKLSDSVLSDMLHIFGPLIIEAISYVIFALVINICFSKIGNT